MAVCKTEAITLRRTDYSDSSQIITFYTRDYGKIHTLAKGFKRIAKKSCTKAVDLLTHNQILFIKKEHTSLYTLTEAILQDSYPLLRLNLDKYYRASYSTELVNEFTEENDPSEQLFDTFLDTVRGLSTDADATIRMLVFEIKLLKISGYLPEWRHCVNCKDDVQQRSEVYFNAKEGGVLCDTCGTNGKSGIMVPTGSMLIAGRLSELNMQKLERVKLPLPICVEIEKMLRYYINFVLNKELNSWRYLRL